MSLNKCTSIFIAVLLLISNAGLAFNVHYCEGKIASIRSVYSSGEVCDKPEAPADKACCAEAAKDHKSCCKDKQVHFKDKSDDRILKVIPSLLDVFVPVCQWTTVPFYNEAPVLKQQCVSYYCDAHAPPLFKLYHQYIFYA